MATKNKKIYYLIIEINGDVVRKNIPTSTSIRGLYSTQEIAQAELFKIATRYHDDGTTFCYNEVTKPCMTLSQIIHENTLNGETTIMGYNPKNFKIVEFQIRTLNLDTPTLIIN